MSPRARRLARGWVAAFVATTLAAGSHAAVDGTWPSPLIIALSMCLAAPLCMLLAGRALSRWSVAGSVLLSQALLHTLYAQSGGMAHAIDYTHHHAASTADGPAVVISVLPAAHHGCGMLAAHAVAAVATYVLLRHGETAAFRLLNAVSLRVLRILVLALRPVTTAVPRRTSWTSPRALADQLLLSSVCGYRGPPALA
ncbi:hypothetical protein [Kocuria marina]|uniref:Integral membrane protein n=1 Tax=Kocuria marina subsp. indica TaxID=1049583 RepID=A0A1X7CAR5_9MICC|nr:hypothetical protein [Kocuria indica]OXS85377.1 hypothetical protein B1B07_01855 [Kocuria indica]RLP59092.1 hypothetical protein D9R06_02760 [Kocuria indica]SME93004.1 hypothetical protein SAMN06296028_10269 [Kocuria indica]